MKWNPYLNFNGDCREAFELYVKTFGGTIEMMSTFGEMPPGSEKPPGFEDKILHARMSVGDNVLMASDSPPEHYEAPSKAQWIAIAVDTDAEAERIFKALAEKGNVVLPIQETFWASRFGMTTDRFGIPWMVSCNKPMQ
jgi:PhnB protein